MASGVEELLDMLFEMVDEAKNMPLSSDKCVLERDRALDLIDAGRLDVQSMICAVRGLEQLPEILHNPKLRAKGKYIISPEL